MELKDIKERFLLAPISINCQLGDPFQSNQWAGTQKRILDLQESNHKGPVALITKSIITQSQLDWLRDKVVNLNLFVYFSVTGLTEKYGTQTILGNFKDVATECKNIKPIIFIRPIIPGKNDDINILEPIIETAAKYAYKHALIYRGYKDIEDSCKNVKLNEKFIAEFEKCTQNMGAVIFPKTRLLAMSSGIPHLMNLPKVSKEDANDFLSLVGYDDRFSIIGDSIHMYGNHISEITKGDIHFIEMFTGWNVSVDSSAKYRDQRSILSISLFGQNTIDSTSSWLGWGENKPCVIGCPYCIAFAEQKDYKEFGCNFDKLL